MSHPAFKNYVVPIPGTTVTAYLAQRVSDPAQWIYSLWEGQGDDEHDIATGELSTESDGIILETEPEQIARIAFLLEVEYTTS